MINSALTSIREISYIDEREICKYDINEKDIKNPLLCAEVMCAHRCSAERNNL